MKAKIISLLSILFGSILLTPFLLLGTVSEAAALPPRPTAVPTHHPPQLHGGFIELHVEGQVVEDIWTVVQWQDKQDNWHDVTGWQGALDAGNSKTWWVGEEDLATGPFRWVVMQDSTVLGMSDPFFLPARSGEKVLVAVSIAD